MSQLTASKTTKSCGCGCGGGGAAACTCHDPCGGCAADTFVRPRFFAGQLLTEEDLQLLAGYVVAKDRLHNRYLHGPGVVCGLEVTCDPCGKGKIAVHPGYALDCCGNDILVPCTVELDVNAMIRRLRLDKLGGHDCGDPCEEESRRAAAAAGSAVPAPNPERAARRYCLYVEYCEESTDPVTPYIAEEPCGGRPCETTRIREGYRFSLRCPEKEVKPDNLFGRIKACLDDLPRAERALGDAQAYDHMAWRVAAAQKVVEGERRAAFEAEDRRIMMAATSRLREPGPGDEAAEKALDEAAARRRLDDLFNAARPAVAFALLDGEARRGLIGQFSQLQDEVGEAVKAARAEAERVDRLTPKLSSPRDRVFAAALAEETLRWTEPEIEARSARAAVAPPAEMAYFAHGALWSNQSVQARAALDLAAVREWLLDRLDRGAAADCQLRQEVLAIQVPRETSTDAATFSAAARRLVQAVMRYLLDCICAALNPPCVPCDDPAVLLACLEVEECDVVTICNLERTWVLTPNALRYWVPLLSGLGEALERLCCETPRQLMVSKVEREEPRLMITPPPRQMSAFSASAPLYEAARQDERVARLLRFTGLPETTLAPSINVVGSLRSIAVSSSITPALGLPQRAAFARVEGLGAMVGGAAGGGLRREDLLAVLAEDEVREAVTDVVTTAFEEQVEAKVAETARPLNEKTAENAAAVTRLERALEKRLTVKDLQDSKVVKDLRAANTALKETVDKLAKANTDLAARLQRLESGEVPRG